MSDAILDVQNLVGGYGKMTILNGTTFSVPAGSITTVIGPVLRHPPGTAPPVRWSEMRTKCED